jgi:FlaG/FlaF family flagellin (archaellin)
MRSRPRTRSGSRRAHAAIVVALAGVVAATALGAVTVGPRTTERRRVSARIHIHGHPFKIATAGR